MEDINSHRRKFRTRLAATSSKQKLNLGNAHSAVRLTKNSEAREFLERLL